MFPAQTSFIPIQIALARFLENQGIGAIFQNYPYWYLGTTPFRYLTGPILPLILIGAHKIMPFFSLFEIMFLLIGLVWPLGAAGVYLLTRRLEGNKLMAALAAIFFFFGPLMPFLFRFYNGISLISLSFLPYILLIYLDFLETIKLNSENSRLRKILLGMLILLLLIDIACLPKLLLGMAAMFLAIMGWKKVEKGIKESLLLIAYGILLITIWYLPGYWWQIIMAPSLAGKSLFQVVSQLGQLLPIALAITMAIVSSRFVKLKGKLFKFSFYWLFIFGFLTLIRFISDLDFWLDWSIYALEIQMGLAVALALLASKFQKEILSIKFILILLCVFTIYLLLFTITTKKYVLGTLQKDIRKSVEYQVGQELAKVYKPGDKIFLSGSTVFWLNAFFDLSQVRGGNDGPSVNHDWRAAAWEIREGTDPQKSLDWFKKLGVSYLVVHNSSSAEYYHDFVYPAKFESLGNFEKIFDQKGDQIYRVK